MAKTYARRTTNECMSWQFRQLPFWDRVARQTVINDNGCHIFTGHKDECGYGRIKGEGDKLVRVHRAVYQRHHGEIPSNIVVCHKCDNPACINPDHLFAGKQAENIADMDSKGRRITLRGSTRPLAKLREENIPHIRSRLSDGESCASIARDYGVSEGLIRHVKKGRNWSHVP